MVLRLLKWIWRAWPVLAVTAMIMAHWLVLIFLPSHWEIVNKTVALVLQVIGGFLVLYSIDSNIGVIRGRSLGSEFRQYLAQFPLLRKTHVIEAKGASCTLSSGEAELKTTRNPATMEEKLDYLQEQIDQIRVDFRDEISKIRGEFNQRKKEVEQKIGSLSKSINNVESIVEEVSVGSIKIQIFGVLLLVHGGFSGYIV